MARIIPGALCVAVSGSAGPLTFRDTRFGQVVQAKTIPPVYTTPAALATKDRFRKAMASWSAMNSFHRFILTLRATASNRNPPCEWVAHFYRLLKDGTWPLNYRWGSNIAPINPAATWDGAHYWLTIDWVPTHPLAAWAWLFAKDGVIPYIGSGYEYWPPSPLPRELVHALSPPPATFIILPYANHEDVTLGFTQALHVT